MPRALLNLGGLRETLGQARLRLSHRTDQGVRTLLLVAGCIALVGVVLFIAPAGYHSGFHGVQKVSHALLPDFLWAALTNFGDGKYLFVLSLFFVRRRPEIYWAMIVSGILAALYSQGMKLSFDTLRPPAVLPASEIMLIGPALMHHSFPSGHTLTAFMFAGVLVAFSTTWTTRLLLIAGATLVGISRVALGVHWPEDVLAGAASGLAIAALGVWITSFWLVGLKPAVHLCLLALPLIAMWMLLVHAGDDPAGWIAYPLVFAGLVALLRDYRDLFAAS